MIDYQSELNPCQYEAATSTDGKYLVIAGAGSGKTRTLVYRVAHLIETGTPPPQILLLTFTRKAANEMMKRATKMLDERCQDITGGTFHSYAFRMLHIYADRIGYPNNFTVLDSADAESIFGLILKEPEFVGRKKLLPTAKQLLSLVSKSTNLRLTIARTIEVFFSGYRALTSTIEIIADRYQKHKADRCVMDYDDLLTKFLELLEEHPDIRKRLSNRHRYIMVDEYQDTNTLQADIVKLLSEVHGNVMVVGDDSQSIYGFRGANFKNIIDFPEQYPDCKTITLEQNYRSTQEILDFSNAILESAEEKYAKTLFTQNNSDSPRPRYMRPYSDVEQAYKIVGSIRAEHSRGVPYDEIAVLFRAAWHSHVIEAELMKNRVPFVKYGGKKFTDFAHIKDMLALLRVLINPRDEMAWLRVLNLFEGIGAKTSLKISTEILKNEYDGLLAFSGKKKFGQSLSELRDVLTESRTTEVPFQQMLKDLGDYYIPIMKRKYQDEEEDDDEVFDGNSYQKGKMSRELGIETLVQIAESYKSPGEFLADLLLESPDRKKGDNKDMVTLSTVHSAKGLEWETVYVIHLSDQLFPSARAGDKEEERRLFYVAVTRAKRGLVLSSPYSAAYLHDLDQSMFITENRHLHSLMVKV